MFKSGKLTPTSVLNARLYLFPSPALSEPIKGYAAPSFAAAAGNPFLSPPPPPSAAAGQARPPPPSLPPLRESNRAAASTAVAPKHLLMLNASSTSSSSDNSPDAKPAKGSSSLTLSSAPLRLTWSSSHRSLSPAPFPDARQDWCGAFLASRRQRFLATLRVATPKMRPQKSQNRK